MIAPPAAGPTRFNPGSLASSAFETLYLALDESTALLEKRVQFGDPSASPIAMVVNTEKQKRTTLIDINVNLRDVVDLTNLSGHQLLATNAQEITGDWHGYELRGRPGVVLDQPVGLAPTQILGQELFHAPGIEGIKAISAKNPTTCCLIIFTEKLTRPGSLAWDDPNTGTRERYP